MHFNPHSDLEGRHALLSASKYHWIRYDDEKLADMLGKSIAAQHGTALHAWAHTTINLKLKQSSAKKTLNMYINDAIGYRMHSEQPLMYSLNCFGTPDTISFTFNRKTRRHMLRIHDLKTGEGVAKFDQLLIYAAMFCHEYDEKPHTIDIELRIYQNDEVRVLSSEVEPIADLVLEIMDQMVRADEIIEIEKEALFS
jgi:hypothetical protein